MDISNRVLIFNNEFKQAASRYRSRLTMAPEAFRQGDRSVTNRLCRGGIDVISL